MRFLENFINSLPKLEDIKKIILHRLISHKELITIKLVLDLYENYLKQYDYPLYENYLNEYIPTAMLFYSNLTEEDTKAIFDKIKGEKEIYDIIKLKLKCLITKKKNKYLKNLNRNKADILGLLGGSGNDKFCY